MSNTRYRAIGYGSTVDESLFGSSSDSATFGKGTRKTTTGPIAPSAAVISVRDLIRIKNEAVIKTEAEIRAEKERAEQLKEEKDKLSKERKLKMKELEKRAVLLAKKSDIEIAEESKKNTLKAMAQEQLDNNSDVVKLLNSMAQRATAFTLREKQLEEKHRLEQMEREFDKRMDILIEIDRIKDIQRREEDEREKRTKRVEDRKVINVQIAEREKKRQMEMEARELENLAMKDLMKRYQDEDAANAAKRAVMIEKSKKDVLIANEAAIRRKQENKAMERKEVEDILIYQAQRDAELAKREEDEAALERAKKERQLKLLAQQEKAQNNAGKLDELRARRAIEEKERQLRTKEKAEAMKRKADMKELLESRAQQAADKLERQKAVKAQEEEEIMNQLMFTKKMDDRENYELRVKEEKKTDFRIKLQKQIEDIERLRKLNASSGGTKDGPNIREELIREEAKLTVIRDKMVEDLIQQGVNPKYLSEMVSVDIGKILKR